MKLAKTISWAGIVFLITWALLAYLPKALATAPNGDIAIIEIKMTSSESLVLDNISSGSVNLQNYLLQYFSNRSPLNLNTPTGTQALPNFNLAPNQSFLLSGDTAATCGAAGTANLGMSLSDTSGYIQVVKVAQQSGSTVYTTQDHVNWTSSTTTPTDITQVPSAASDAAAVWYRKLSDGSWNKYEIDATACNLLVSVASTSSTTYTQWAAGEIAPATIVAASANVSAGIPADDIGLAAVQITEILPNPASPQTDTDDEFIELYNPNDRAFDLSGFTLEIGLTTKHDFSFDSSTSLPPRAFSAFYSSDTGLSLSNSGGQVWLLDPTGGVVSQTDAYSSAKDGQAWALASGTWYWTTTPTPNAANLINGVPASSDSLKSKTKTTPVVSAAGTGSSNGGSVSSSSGSGSNTPATATPIHTWTLAVVGSAALIYAAYEYRTDLANRFNQLRRYRETRALAGKSFIPAGVRGIGQRFGRWQNYVHAWFCRWFKK